MKRITKYAIVSLVIAVIMLAGLLNGCSLITGESATQLPDPPANTYATGLIVPVPLQIRLEAERIVENVKITSYQHPTDVDEDNGIYRVDCSGLADYILKRVAPDNYRQIPKDGEPRPYAEHFYQYFRSLGYTENRAPGGWTQIKRLADADAGDILVYEYTEASKKAKGTTGHVMIIQSKPVKQSNGDYMVWVIDSANSGHGSDTRTGDGVGMGKMWFGVDKEGRPVYYRWSSASGDKHSEGLLGITVGRAG